MVGEPPPPLSAFRSHTPTSSPILSNMGPPTPRPGRPNNPRSTWQKYLLWLMLAVLLVNVFFAIKFQGHLQDLLHPHASPVGLALKQSSQNRDRLIASGHTTHSSSNLQNHIIESTSQAQSSQHYAFNRELAEDSLKKYGRDAIFQPLRAYIEKPLNDTVPGTVDTGNLDEKKPKIQVGRPAKWWVPLPLREGSPDEVSHLFVEKQYMYRTFIVRVCSPLC